MPTVSNEIYKALLDSVGGKQPPGPVGQSQELIPKWIVLDSMTSVLVRPVGERISDPGVMDVTRSITAVFDTAMKGVADAFGQSAQSMRGFGDALKQMLHGSGVDLVAIDEYQDEPKQEERYLPKEARGGKDWLINSPRRPR